MSESDDDFVERMFGYIKLRTNDFNRLKAIALRGAEAADEIERLRAWNEEIAVNARHFAEALRLIRDMGPMTVDDQRWRIAKDALEGE